MAVSPMAIKAYSAASELLNNPKGLDGKKKSTTAAGQSFADTIEESRTLPRARARTCTS
jgi:flagellar hook-basal body complex protein FliE